MTPIYFPFTWADVPTIQAITAVFPHIAMYQSSVCKVPSLLQPYEHAGALEIRVPVTNDSDKMETLVTEYQNWARLHQGNDLTFLKARQPAAPFMENLSSRIRSDILHYQDASPEPVHDPAFNARLFLEIAAAYDAQHAELNCDFTRIRNLEKRFMAALGDHTEMEETAPLGNLSLIQDDPGDFMLAERLQAWSRLVLQDRRQRSAADIWVTSRLSVLEWMKGEIDMAPILEINCIPVQKAFDDNTRFWQESIMSYLSRLQAIPWPSPIKPFEPPSSDYAWENAASVKGFIIANQSPEALLQKMAADTSARTPDSGQIRHTLVVCVSPICIT